MYEQIHINAVFVCLYFPSISPMSKFVYIVAHWLSSIIPWGTVYRDSCLCNITVVRSYLVRTVNDNQSTSSSTFSNASLLPPSPLISRSRIPASIPFTLPFPFALIPLFFFFSPVPSPPTGASRIHLTIA